MGNDTRCEDRLQVMSLVEELCDRHGPELGADELEALANALLHAYGSDEHYPHLLDQRHSGGSRGFDSYSLEEQSAITQAALQLPAPSKVSPEVVRLRTARLLTAARLTGRRRQVAGLRLGGCAPPEIAKVLGLQRSVVYREWRYAKRALGIALASGDWDRGPAPEIAGADVRELFRSEQRKTLYRKPTHCARGKEKCRRTGVCPYGS